MAQKSTESDTYAPVQNLARRRQASEIIGKSDKESMDLSSWYIVILKNFQLKTWHKSQNGYAAVPLTEVWEDETQMSARKVNSLPPQQSITTAIVHQKQSPWSSTSVAMGRHQF